MSAKVKPSVWGGWIGYCQDCNATVAGNPSMVDLWADVHNSESHKETADV